jgi:hypothetical protein
LKQCWCALCGTLVEAPGSFVASEHLEANRKRKVFEMKKVIASSLAILISALSLGSIAHAQSFLGSRQAEEHVAIAFLPPLSDRPSDGDVPEEYRDPPQAVVAEAQGEVSSDANLRAILLSHNVELNNVVAIGSAGNGDRIVYVR